MLTVHKARSSPSPGPAPSRGGLGPPGRAFRACLDAAALLLVSGTLFTSPQHLPPNERRAPDRLARPTQYEACGSRWLDSNNQELVHFVCEPGAPYVVSLNSASMIAAGLAPEAFPAFLEALREAVADWRAVLRCDRIRVEMDGLDADTRVFFAYIDTPGTLAVGTRAEDIVLSAGRSWFPGSKRQGNYGDRGRAVSFYWVVAHELGHVWGIAHSDSPSSLMYPTQCDSCRWSSFEQAAGNLIHAAGLVPDWSRPYYANRFFVRTPLAVIPRLLTGELPDEPLWSTVAEQCVGDGCTSTLETDPWLADPLAPEPPGRSSLMGLQALRGLRPVDLGHLGMCSVSAAPHPARSVPLPPDPKPGATDRRLGPTLAPRFDPPWEGERQDRNRQDGDFQTATTPSNPSVF